MLRRESRQRRAEVDAENMLKKLAQAERDSMCDAMWTMCLVHKKSLAAAMADTRNWGKKKTQWEREQAALEVAEHAPPVLVPSSDSAGGVLPGRHWGDPVRRSPALVGAASAAMAAAVASTPSEPIVKEARGRWTAPFSGGGGSGAFSLGKRKKPSSAGGLRFSLKGKAQQGRKARAPPPLPQVMAEAVALAEAEEEKRVTAAPVVTSVGGEEQDGTGDWGEADGAQVTSQIDAMDVESVVSDAAADDVAAVGARIVRQAVPSTVVAAPVVPTITIANSVPRVKLSCSGPLLASNGSAAGIKLERAIYSDPRMVRMRWQGGLVMVTAIIKDAPGGQGLPGIKLTQSPTRLVIEALGSKITIASPPEMTSMTGFTAACSGNGITPVKELRRQVHKLDGHVEEHARGGDESLRLVENLREKRLVLAQVGEILKEDYQPLPALGGAWMAAFHSPDLPRQSNKWSTGSATPTVEIRLLMRRSCLAEEGGLTVQEDAAYVETAAAAVAAKVAAVAEVTEESEGEDDLQVGNDIDTVEDYVEALGDKIYGDQVREVVSRAVDGVVQGIMLKEGKEADLRDVVMWRAEESKRLRLAERGGRQHYTRMFSLVEDSDEEW